MSDTTRTDAIRAAYDKTLFDARVKGVVTPPPSWSDVGALLTALDEAVNSFSDGAKQIDELKGALIEQTVRADEAELRHQSGKKPLLGSPTPRTDAIDRDRVSYATPQYMALLALCRVLEVEAETLRAMQGERHQVCKHGIALTFCDVGPTSADCARCAAEHFESAIGRES